MTQKINLVRVLYSNGDVETAVLEDDDNLKAYILRLVEKYSGVESSIDWVSDSWFTKALMCLSYVGVLISLSSVDFYPKYPGLDECLMNSEQYTQEQRELIIDAVGKWQNNEL